MIIKYLGEVSEDNRLKLLNQTYIMSCYLIHKSVSWPSPVFFLRPVWAGRDDLEQ